MSALIKMGESRHLSQCLSVEGYKPMPWAIRHKSPKRCLVSVWKNMGGENT